LVLAYSGSQICEVRCGGGNPYNTRIYVYFIFARTAIRVVSENKFSILIVCEMRWNLFGSGLDVVVEAQRLASWAL
jgi:hypothetical protein